MKLTKRDYQVLFPIALEMYNLNKSVSGIYTQIFLETTIGQKFLVETLFVLEQSEAEMKEIAIKGQKELKKLAEEDEEEDTIFDGINRCFKLWEYGQKAIAIAQGQGGIIFWPVAFLVGKFTLMLRKKQELAELRAKQNAIKKAERHLKKKGIKNPTNEQVAVLARRLSVREKQVLIRKQINEIKQKGDLSWIDKVKVWCLDKWKKIFPEKMALHLAEILEKLKALAMRNPLLTGLVAVMAVCLVIFTIFKWGKIKKFFKFLVRIVTAPIRVLIKGIKWILDKLIFWRKKKPGNQEFALVY